jgi:alkanesulfonate monooxygenase SsuD/methylene tetrahydromethanopterin reductase-like flavin-dependent oxidoreductase (luciferase family)
MATAIDHISNGRFGMNLVMGWFTPEMELFGRRHERRHLRLPGLRRGAPGSSATRSCR